MSEIMSSQLVRNTPMAVQLVIIWSNLFCSTIVSLAQEPRSQVRYSPDNAAILFSRKVERRFSKIFIEKSNGKELQVTFGKHQDNCPDWSPDGKQFVFASMRSGGWKIYKANIDGSNVICLSEMSDGTVDNTPQWSPGGKRISFVSNRSGRFQIHQMDTDGSNVTQMTKGENKAFWPKYSADGRLGYLVHRGSKSKSPLYDLMILDKEVHDPFLIKQPLQDFTWCKGGELIAYSLAGSIVFHEFNSKRNRKFTLKEIDARLSSHGAKELHWNPGKRMLVSRLYFRGGILEGSVVFGDGASLMISPTGMIKRLEE